MTTTKKATATRTPASKKTAAKRTTARKATGRSTTGAGSAGAASRDRAGAGRLHTAGYATVALVGDVVDAARRVPGEVDRALGALGSTLETKAAEGRTVVDGLTADERLVRIAEQTAATRAQVKAAMTSIRRTGTAAVDAAGEQAAVARSRVKGAATSSRRSAATVKDAFEG